MILFQTRVFALVFVLYGIFVATDQLALAQTDNSLEEGEGFGNVTLSSPQRDSLAATPAPVPFSDEVIQELERRTEKTLNTPPIGILNETVAPPPNASESLLANQTDTASQDQIGNIMETATVMGTSSNSPQTSEQELDVLINRTVTPSQSRSVVGEPSVANKGPIVFFTGNWYVARSNDNGSTWNYLNPLEGMPDFCCDQDVIYDPNHGVFIWYRQGVAEDFTGMNRVRIGISPDATNWWFYNIRPTNLNPSWQNQWLDYPHLSLSNDHLFITSNMFDAFGDFVRTVIVRLPMEDLSNAAVPEGEVYFSNQVGTFTPVQGAKGTMFWAAHQDNGHMVLYKWDDDQPSSTVERNVIEIPIWSFNPTLYSCPTPREGDNWCARSDPRITGGWLIGNHTGFFWNVDRGGEFPWPYVDSALFNVDNMTYQGRPLIWSPNYAVLYAYAAPNERGELGLIATFGGGETEPSIAADVNELDANSNLSTWVLSPLINGTHVPLDNEWGDYLRVRPYNVTENVWTATGYTLQGGSTMAFVEPRLLVFGTSNSTGSNDEAALVASSGPPSFLSKGNTDTLKSISLSGGKKEIVPQ